MRSYSMAQVPHNIVVKDTPVRWMPDWKVSEPGGSVRLDRKPESGCLANWREF